MLLRPMLNEAVGLWRLRIPVLGWVPIPTGSWEPPAPFQDAVREADDFGEPVSVFGCAPDDEDDRAGA